VTSLVCVGDVLVDVLARLAGPLAPGSDSPAPIALYGGGAAANVAAWSVVAGADATFVGRVGDDALGHAVLADLRQAGVEARVEVDDARSTGVCVVLVDPDGERTMIPSAGANAAPNDLAALPEHADWLYLSGYVLLRPGTRAFALEVLAAARHRGWSIAVDAASAAPLQTVGGPEFLNWLGADVLLFANAAEAAVLVGHRDAAAAAVALGRMCGSAIVKQGADGAVWSDGSAVHTAAPVPRQVIDSTGAGDAFAAGFLAASGDPATKLAAATRLAVDAVGRVGARPAGTLGAFPSDLPGRLPP
jgi:sugar/nucleoside kinase (ribokinase family)